MLFVLCLFCLILVTNVLITVHNYYARAYKNKCHVISDRRLVFESCRQGDCVYMYICPSPLTGDLYSSLVGRVAVCIYASSPDDH